MTKISLTRMCELAAQKGARDAQARIKELEAVLREAREDLAAYVDSDYPDWVREKYPDTQRRWHRDMELCRRIDALIAQEGQE